MSQTNVMEVDSTDRSSVLGEKNKEKQTHMLSNIEKCYEK